MVSACLASLTAALGGGHQEEPFFPAGRIVEGLPFPPLLAPSITTCPPILGQQLDSHQTSVPRHSSSSWDLGGWWLHMPPACVSSPCTLCPPPTIQCLSIWGIIWAPQK